MERSVSIAIFVHSSIAYTFDAPELSFSRDSSHNLVLNAFILLHCRTGEAWWHYPKMETDTTLCCPGLAYAKRSGLVAFISCLIEYKPDSDTTSYQQLVDMGETVIV